MSTSGPPGPGQKRLQARSVNDLMQYVKQLPEISDETSIKSYYGASDTLLQQAESYSENADPEREFVSLMKYVTLLVERLPKHKQYSSALGKQLKKDHAPKLKETLSRLETLRPLLQHAYELRAAEEKQRQEAEARERQRRQEEIAERQRQAQMKAAEEAAKAAAALEVKKSAPAEDSEEDELLARARKLRLTNSNPVSDSSIASANADNDVLDAGSDASDSELPALSPEELKAFEKELESEMEDASPGASTKDTPTAILSFPSPELDEVFASGKYIGGLDAIGNSAIAKPETANVIAPGYAITVTPFTDGVLRPDVVENNPPLIDLNATMRPQTLLMAPSQQQAAGGAHPPPHLPTPNLMDLSTIPNPSNSSQNRSNAASSPLLSFAPPPAVVPPSAPPLEIVAPAAPPSISGAAAPLAAPVVPSAPTETIVAAPSAKVESAQVRPAPSAAAVLPASSSGDALVMERPKKKSEPTSEPEIELEKQPSAPPMELEPAPAAPKRSERMGELPPPQQQKKSPTVSKKVSFDDTPAELAVEPKKKSSKKSKGPSSSTGTSPASSSSRKYSVTVGVSEPDPSDQDPMMSITKTYRNKQYNPREDASLRPRLEAAPAGPTCTNDTPSSSASPASAPSPRTGSPQPMQMMMVPSHSHGHSHAHGHNHSHGHNHGIQYGRPMPGQPFYVPSPSQPQYVQMANQQVPVVYSPFQNPQVFQNAQQIVYQPQSGATSSSAVMPVMYGVPVAFRPQMLSIYGQTNKPQGALQTSAAPPKAAEASAPPLLRSKDLEDSSDSSEEDEPKPSKKSRKPSSKTIPKPALKKKAPKLIDGLRQIDVDGEIFDSFMRSAHNNTSREIETCGILCGRMHEDESGFSVTHLIIPKQTGTTDTCATTDEEEIFTYQMKKDLLTLGWIHTHPTQACFLSSVDLHTQASYQGLFPEALAVVIAPRDQPNFSIFHLTPHGLMTVQACPLKGFHLHDEIRLYEPTSHVQLRWGQKKYKVVDMR